jgi:hypothetical protein
MPVKNQVQPSEGGVAEVFDVVPTVVVELFDGMPSPKPSSIQKRWLKRQMPPEGVPIVSPPEQPVMCDI